MKRMCTRNQAIVVLLAAGSLVACQAEGDPDSATAPIDPRSAAATSDAAAATTDEAAGEVVALETTTTEETAEGTTGDVRSITVGGVGAEYAAPVRSIVNLAVNVRRPSVAEASEAASAAGEAVLAALEVAGVESSGIQTSEFRIEPVYDAMNYQLITGYQVYLGYNVSFSEVDDVGSVLAEAVVAGGDDVRAYSVRFEPDPIALMDGARTKAWEDVAARAAATAQLAGEPLGHVLDVHEKVLITSPQGMMQGGEGDSASFDIPVAPGLAGVTVLLTVTYAIGA